VGGENRRDAARGDDGPHFSPQRSDPPVKGVGEDRAWVACPEKFPAAAAGAPLDGAADPGACVSLRPGVADRMVDEKSPPTSNSVGVREAVGSIPISSTRYFRGLGLLSLAPFHSDHIWFVFCAVAFRTNRSKMFGNSRAAPGARFA